MKGIPDSRFVPRRVENVERRELRFARVGDDAAHPLESFYCFDCDATGAVDVSSLTEPHLDIWRRAHDRSLYQEPVQFVWVERHVTPATVECGRCGRVVRLPEFTNTCVCGADYNMQGQLLATRQQWGWDTGETADDILAAGHHVEEE